MLLSWIVGGILCLKLSRGQAPDKKICDIDPDLIYFENDDLERIRNLFILGGECSDIWKGGFNKVVQNHLRDDVGVGLSQPDRMLFQELAGYQQLYESPAGEDLFENNKRGLRSQNPSDLVFGSKNQQRSQQSPSFNYFLGVGGENDQNQRYVDHIVPERQYKRQILQPDFFGFNGPRRTQGRQNLFRPQNQNNVKSPNIQRRPQNQRFPVFFGGPGLRRPENQFDIFSSGGGRPQKEVDSFPSGSQRRPQVQAPSSTKPQSGGRIENAVSDSRRPQVRPENFFFPNGMTPQNGGGFFPSARPQNQRRPNDIVMPDQSRPQTNVLKPVNQRPNAKQTVIQRPEMTPSSRPETTTLPGPPTWATAPSVCVRECPNTPEYNPVCGSDKVTYRNPGRLRCEQRCGKANVDVNHYGTCVTTTTPDPRTTPRTPTGSRSGINNALFRM